MSVDAVEFIRRFLLHILPKGFMHIRHFGFLANRNRSEKLSRCRELVGKGERLARATPGDVVDFNISTESPECEHSSTCPACKKGRMVYVGRIDPHPEYLREILLPMVPDTS